MIDLKQITTQLIEADENNAGALTKLMPLELAYQQRLDQLVMSSQRVSQPLREAEARASIALEPIYEEYLEAKLRARLSYQRLDTLKVVSANLRSLRFGGSEA